MAGGSRRETEVRAQSTDTFGRVLCTARTHHFVVDGPVQNGCPGEALTPPEAFLAAVAACGVELVQVIAREAGTSLERFAVVIRGIVDRAAQPRTDVTLFNSVSLRFTLAGPGLDRAGAVRLIDDFRRR
jgi:uncharacterized OsmC-like protein